jgi:transposase
MMANKFTNNTDRRRIIDAYINGESAVKIAQLLSLKRKTVDAIIKIYTSTGRIEYARRGGLRYKKLNQLHVEWIKNLIGIDCSVSLRKIAELFHIKFNFNISKSTIGRAISNFNYSFKRVSMVPVARNTECVIEQKT